MASNQKHRNKHDPRINSTGARATQSKLQHDHKLWSNITASLMVAVAIIGLVVVIIGFITEIIHENADIKIELAVIKNDLDHLGEIVNHHTETLFQMRTEVELLKDDVRDVAMQVRELKERKGQ